MALERLQLTNFRGFESLDLTFEPDLTVLVGANGCGKSSVLDALVIGLGLQEWQPRDIRVGAKEATIRVATAEHPHQRMTGELVADGSKVAVSGSGTTTSSSLMLVYGTRRGTHDDTPGATLTSAWPPPRARMESFGSVGYVEFFRWFREMEDEENERMRYEGGSENPALRAVRNATHRLLPGYTNLRIRRGGAMGDLRPRLTLEKDGELLLFDALSEGERTLVAMIADIARRLTIAYPDTDEPLAQPCLLVIDEFEQHLHPQWQRELPARMREVFPGAQMILTTHSPIVVSELLPQHLRAIKDFRLLEGAHREGQDVNEILEAVFGTASRNARTQALIDEAYESLDEDDLDVAASKLDVLERQLGADEPEVVRLKTLHRMLDSRDHDAVSEG